MSKNTTIRQIKRVKTPEGEGTIECFDPELKEYLVRIAGDTKTYLVRVRMEDIVELPRPN